MEVLTAKEVAEVLKLTPATVYKLVREGVIPGFKIANEWRFERQVLEAWIAEQTMQTHAYAQRRLAAYGRQAKRLPARAGGGPNGGSGS